jgi:predicted amidohydrolase YtcJ
VTGDTRRPTAAAIAVAGGRVVAVGTRHDVAGAAGPRATRVDCAGDVLMPGIVDPHVHLFGLAARDSHLDCSQFDSIGALLGAVRARAHAQPAGGWLRGEGLDEARLGRLPTAVELERASPRHPVRLRHRSRHASVLSVRALARLPRGLAGVERRRGRPTGLVAGHEDAIGRAVGPLSAGAIAAGLARASRELAAAGVTTIADATPRRPAELGPIRRAIAAGTLVQRVFAMRPWDAPAWRGRSRLQPGPVKILVEETPDGLVPDACEIARRVRVAAARGDQVAVHCTGAATLVASLAAFAALPHRLRAGRRHRLEHVGECPPPLVARIAALDLTVVTNPAFVYWRGDVYRQETRGAARSWLYRARSLAAAGVPVAAASDAPVSPADPWCGMAAARSRRTRGGHVLGPTERVDAAAALAMWTTAAARALRADRLGVLRRGGPADLILVSRDPLRASVASVSATRVRLAMVDGAGVWRA